MSIAEVIIPDEFAGNYYPLQTLLHAGGVQANRVRQWTDPNALRIECQGGARGLRQEGAQAAHVLIGDFAHPKGTQTVSSSAVDLEGCVGAKGNQILIDGRLLDHYRANLIESLGDPEATSGLLNGPFLDSSAIEIVRKISEITGWKAAAGRRWPNGKNFAVALTHDIDVVGRGMPLYAIRRLRRALRAGFGSGLKLRSKSALLCLEELYRSLVKSRGDSAALDLYQWRRLENKYGVPATYFFATPPKAAGHVNDPIYQLYDRVVFDGRSRRLGDVLQFLRDDGAEIGLHGSIASGLGLSRIVDEKEDVENKLGEAIVGVRQHYLCYQFPETFANQAQAGFLYDASVGYNKGIGCRVGTSNPYELTHLTGQDRPFYEVPFVLQDVSPLVDRKDIPALMVTVRRWLDEVESVHGLFCIVWHNYSYRDISVPSHLAQYEAILEEVAKRDPWIASLDDVIRHRLSRP